MFCAKAHDFKLQLMKNTITILIAALIIACGLPSCGATIIKRHHNHGYYINKNPGLQKTDSDRVTHRLTKSDSGQAENLAKETKLSSEKHTASVSVPKEPETTSAANEQSGITASTPETGLGNTRQTRADANKMQEVKPSLYEWSSTTRLAEKRKMAFADEQYGESASGASGAADTGSLSLFGIVILIILVVWLIAILTGGWGLGGFIHVLIVIALILLILWLLRII